MTQEALKLALEALNDLAAWNDGEVGGHMDEPYAADTSRKAITAIKEALAQTQEPVAWMDADGNVSDNNDHKCFPIPLYTHPPQRTWVGLTDDEENEYNYLGPDMHWVIQEIAAKLKEKNT